MYQNLNIAVASGKGGTGKTLVSVNLAMTFANLNIPVQLLDCDVEAPNDRLFLKAEMLGEEAVHVPVPVIDEEKCNLCGRCVSSCQFNAMAKVQDRIIIFPELCHSCGACEVVCPAGAVREVSHQVGSIYSWQSAGIECYEGELGIGENASVPILNQMYKKVSANKVTILDSAPGAACPVVSVVNRADFVVLVTEPTAFGLHDLKVAAELCRNMNKPLGVVINRSDIGFRDTVDYCEQQQIPILSQIQHSRSIAEHYSRGEVIVDQLPLYKPIFKNIVDSIYSCYDREQFKQQIS